MLCYLDVFSCQFAKEILRYLLRGSWNVHGNIGVCAIANFNKAAAECRRRFFQEELLSRRAIAGPLPETSTVLSSTLHNIKRMTINGGDERNRAVSVLHNISQLRTRAVRAILLNECAFLSRSVRNVKSLARCIAGQCVVTAIVVVIYCKRLSQRAV